MDLLVTVAPHGGWASAIIVNNDTITMTGLIFLRDHARVKGSPVSVCQANSRLHVLTDVDVLAGFATLTWLVSAIASARERTFCVFASRVSRAIVSSKLTLIDVLAGFATLTWRVSSIASARKQS